MSDKKKNTILVFIGVALIIQLGAIYYEKNIWPFSMLTMFAYSKPFRYGHRVVLIDRQMKTYPVPGDWFFPFGRYRTRYLIRLTLEKLRLNNDDRKANYILTDMAKRMQKFCLNQSTKKFDFIKVSFQICDQKIENGCHTLREFPLNCSKPEESNL